ncbi:MAG: hypothetical protein ACD_52C00249G0002 [uncultured bacterium]|nr:MAG: hypothetical protein ACD_52C00249G0002 [uncultured bacterium]
MTKYKEYVDRMISQNNEFFQDFKLVHDKYAQDQDKHQNEFNTIGSRAALIIKEWEDKLCKHSEKAGYSTFTGGLAEKFQAEIRKKFPMIDWIGVLNKKSEPNFFLKKLL